MYKLKSQLHVLRVIALHAPLTHRAFLAHKPYRDMYDNLGQDVELCERHGDWHYQPSFEGYFAKVFFVIRHNRKVYHPIMAVISIVSLDDVPPQRIFLKSGYTGVKCRLDNYNKLEEGLYCIREYSEIDKSHHKFDYWMEQFEQKKLLCKK